MARSTFGGTSDDYVFFTVPFGVNQVVSLGSTVTLTFWSAITGGTQYTDLLLNSVAVTSITTSGGLVPEFQGPDLITEMYADPGGGAPRTLLFAQGQQGPAGPPGPPGPVSSVVGQTGAVTGAQIAADPALSATYATYLSLAKNPDAIITGAIVRDSNGVAISAAVRWPDGTPGTYTADTISTAFPGSVDGYHITYGSPVTRTYTQPTITRDTSGAPTVIPAIIIT